MSFLLLVGALAFFVLHKIYKRLHKISLSDVPGPQPESFILGTTKSLNRISHFAQSSRIGNLRQYFQSQAGAVGPLLRKNLSAIKRCLDRLGMARSLWRCCTLQGAIWGEDSLWSFAKYRAHVAYITFRRTAYLWQIREPFNTSTKRPGIVLESRKSDKSYRDFCLVMVLSGPMARPLCNSKLMLADLRV